jgi:hypothetical protein
MAQNFLKLPLEERKKWIPKWIALAKEYDLNVLFWGSPMGVKENVVVVLESKEYSENIIKFQRAWLELGTPEAKRFIEYTRTVTVF